MEAAGDQDKEFVSVPGSSPFLGPLSVFFFLYYSLSIVFMIVRLLGKG